MTNEEFNRLTRAAWEQYLVITEDVRQELLKTYIDSSELVSAEVLRAERNELSELTIESKRAINEQLDRGVNSVALATEKAVADGISRTIGVEDAISNSWLNSAASDAGLKAFKLEGLNVAVREEILTLTISRQFQDGYALSERVWESASLYKTDMSRVVNLGIAQGKDNIKIAQAISGYTKEGRKYLDKKAVYGKLKPGSGKIYNRISQNVDWRALRLVRSEEQMSLQAAAILRGKNNPGTTGEYNWIKNSFTMHDCTCQSLQDGSPYTEETIPDYPHPNCLCNIEPILRDRETFVEDLAKWSRGVSVPYIDKWYYEKYQLSL